MLTEKQATVRAYPHEYFVTVKAKISGRTTTLPFPDRTTAQIYIANMGADALFSVTSTSFDWHVTIYSITTDTEMSVKFNEISGAESFIEMADRDPNLVVIEYNFVSSV